MAIRFTDEGDTIMAERLALLDPFQLAAPSWDVHPFEKINPFSLFDLPKPTKEQLDAARELQRKQEIEKIMAIKVINETEAPQRLHGRGVISGSTEYSDAIEAIRNIQPGKAIILTLENVDLLKDKKAAMKMAYALRRYLMANNIAATAYANKENEVTIKRAKQGAVKKRKL